MLSKKEQKLIKSLKIKKYRTREKRFLVEGNKNVLELLNSDFKIDFLVGTHAFLDQHRSIIGDHRFESVMPDLLTKLSFLKTNDSVLAVVNMMLIEDEKLDLKDDLFVLDGVSDPGNLGTIIRTLDWFGFDQLVCSLESADFYNPKVIASTMGSFTRMKVFYRDLSEFLSGVSPSPIYSTTMDGDNLFSVSLESPCFILMGSESQGVSRAFTKCAKKNISIPRMGGSEAESLNVGVATGIIASYLRISK